MSVEAFHPWQHGRHWCALLPEPAPMRAGTKRQRAWSLALREAGASDVELAPVYNDRRGRVGVHVHVSSPFCGPRGLAGAWVQRLAAAHVAAVEAMHGPEAARATRAAFEAAGIKDDAIIWVVHLFPGLQRREQVIEAVRAREEAARAAFEAAVKRKAAATTKKKAARKKAATKRKAAKKKAARK